MKFPHARIVEDSGTYYVYVGSVCVGASAVLTVATVYLNIAEATISAVILDQYMYGETNVE